jgi:pentatricopeptide repeat protein
MCECDWAERGRCIHQQIIESGLESEVSVANSLVDMYAKCGSIEDAWRVFNNAILKCGHLECHTWRMCHAWAW